MASTASTGGLPGGGGTMKSKHVGADEIPDLQGAEDTNEQVHRKLGPIDARAFTECTVAS